MAKLNSEERKALAGDIIRKLDAILKTDYVPVFKSMAREEALHALHDVTEEVTRRVTSELRQELSVAQRLEAAIDVAQATLNRLSAEHEEAE